MGKKKDELKELCKIAPEDQNRDDCGDVHKAINAVLQRNGLSEVTDTECERTATKKVLAGLLALEKDSAKLAALEAGGVDNWDFYYDSLKDAGLVGDDDDEGETD